VNLRITGSFEENTYRKRPSGHVVESGVPLIKTYFIACWLPEGGVWALNYDTSKQKILSVRKAAEGAHTSYFERQGNVLYVLSELGGPGDLAGIVQSFNIEGDILHKLDRAQGIPSGSPHLKLVSNGKVLAFASYTTGAVASLSVAEGWFGSLTSLLPYDGHSVNERRQERSHAHMICPAPTGKSIVTCDLGTDTLRIYDLEDDGSLRFREAVPTPLGCGPRHMVFSQDGRYAYVVTELKYRLLIYRWEQDTLHFLRELVIRPDLREGEDWGGAIRLDPEEKLLYTTNRGKKQSTVDVLSLQDPENPILKFSLNGCAHPRDFQVELLDGKRTLILLNMTTDTVEFYEIDEKDGNFQLKDRTDRIPCPVCVI